MIDPDDYILLYVVICYNNDNIVMTMIDPDDYILLYIVISLSWQITTYNKI
jgi:hypothetical protein